MRNEKIRNICISFFVSIWVVVFHYESSRAFILEPALRFMTDKNLILPKLKFLFPPAGWIMFYSVSDKFSNVEVHGIKGNYSQIIDPHDILETRTFGYDNIHRGILGNILYQSKRKSFCEFLSRKFPYFDDFMIVLNYYPDLLENPQKRIVVFQYKCK